MLPHELNALAAVHARWVYDTLMLCTAATLTEFAANPRWPGGIGGFTLVLHTRTQDLRRHLHVHALMACGALRPGADTAPVRALLARSARCKPWPPYRFGLAGLADSPHSQAGASQLQSRHVAVASTGS